MNYIPFTEVDIERNIREREKCLKQQGVELPRDFARIAKANAKAAKRYYKPLTDSDVYNAIEVANFWKMALKSRDEYFKLIVNVIYALYKNQCVSLNNNPSCPELYLERFCDVDKSSELANSQMDKMHITQICVGSDHVTKK